VKPGPAFILYNPPVHIALVGFTRSYNDHQWLNMAGAWMAAHDPAMPWASATQTVFDLRGEAGQNFLDNDGHYDVVVLFAIFNPPAESRELKRALGRRRGQTSLAPNHSRHAWTDRLARTNAKYLFIFRRPDSVDGQWLGEIDPYRRLPERPGAFGVSIYVRILILPAGADRFCKQL
jgi:hypothetical protein